MLSTSQATPALIAELIKKYGPGSVVRGDRTLSSPGRFSTGSFALDYELGGGFTENRMTELRGKFSSCKTTLLLLGMANFIRKYKDRDGLAFYVDLERCWDSFYAKSLGVDLSRCYVIDPLSAEESINIVNDACNHQGPILFGVDSVAAMTPIKELEDEIEKANMALQARLISKMMRVLTPRLRRNRYMAKAPSCSIIFLNQLRSKVGIVYGNPEVTPGGEGKDFYYSVMIRLSASQSEAQMLGDEIDVAGEKRWQRYAQIVDFRINKNKTGGGFQHAEGSMTYYERAHGGFVARRFDNVTPLFHYGVLSKQITLAEGKKSKVFEFKARELSKPIRGMKNAFIEQLQNNKSARMLLRHAVLEYAANEAAI